VIAIKAKPTLLTEDSALSSFSVKRNLIYQTWVEGKIAEELIEHRVMPLFMLTLIES